MFAVCPLWQHLSFSAIFFGSTSSLFTPFLRSSPSLLVDVMTFISDERNKCEGRVTNFAWYNVHGYPLLEESSSNFWQKKGIVGSNPPITDIGKHFWQNGRFCNRRHPPTPIDFGGERPGTLPSQEKGERDWHWTSVTNLAMFEFHISLLAATWCISHTWKPDMWKEVTRILRYFDSHKKEERPIMTLTK